MSSQQAPTFEQLRALVQGRLDPGERLAVSRWLVLHADARVAHALEALSAEWSDMQRDVALSPIAREISEQFWPLFELGLAQFDPDAANLGNGLSLLRGEPGLREVDIRVIDRSRRILRVSAPAGDVAVATNDAEGFHLLGDTTDYECAPQEGRVTFWILSPPSTVEPSTFVEALRVAGAQRSVRAVRITEAFFES